MKVLNGEGGAERALECHFDVEILRDAHIVAQSRRDGQIERVVHYLRLRVIVRQWRVTNVQQEVVLPWNLFQRQIAHGFIASIVKHIGCVPTLAPVWVC